MNGGQMVKVRDKARTAGFPSYFAGMTGTVTEERQFGAYNVRVRLEDGTETWFAKDELEAA